jgi:large subunit ribosomal protein L17e
VSFAAPSPSASLKLISSHSKGQIDYAYKSANPTLSSRAGGRDMTCHYKQMSEVGRAIKGMKLVKAKEYLQRVVLHKDVIPYMRHKGGKGRHAQAKNHKWVVGSGWPTKSTKLMIKLLEDVEANCKSDKKDPDLLTSDLVLNHVQVNRARKMRRRTYRAHGRMGPYVRSPCHVELVAEAPKAKVSKPKEQVSVLVTRKRAALNRSGKVVEGGQ